VREFLQQAAAKARTAERYAGSVREMMERGEDVRGDRVGSRAAGHYGAVIRRRLQDNAGFYAVRFIAARRSDKRYRGPDAKKISLAIGWRTSRACWLRWNLCEAGLEFAED